MNSRTPTKTFVKNRLTKKLKQKLKRKRRNRLQRKSQIGFQKLLTKERNLFIPTYVRKREMIFQSTKQVIVDNED